MLTDNPFKDRTFSGSASSNYAPSYLSDRHYFPTYLQKVNMKPGFLVANQPGLPTVSCDLKSPYSSLSYQKQQVKRKQYVQNPFYKSHLLENSQNSLQNSSSCSKLYSYSNRTNYLDVRNLQEPSYKPIYTQNYNNYQTNRKQIYKPSDDSTQKYQRRLKKANSRGDIIINKEGKINDNYISYAPKPSKTDSIKRANSGPVSHNQFLKKQSKNLNSEYIPLNQQYPPIMKIQSYNNGLNHISQHMAQQIDQQAGFKYPSFNKKQINNRSDSLQSPSFKNIHQVYQKNYLHNIKYEDKDKERIPQPFPTRNTHGEGQSYPGNTLNYQGKTFYLANVDEL